MGLDVPVNSVLLYAQALDATGIDDHNDVYWAGRATLVRKPEDAPAYDAAFAAFWLQRQGHTMPVALPPPVVEEDDDAEDADAGGAKFSPHEVLHHKDFAAYSHAEFDEAR